MAPKAWTAQEVAQYDQGIAAINTELDSLLAHGREQAAELGVRQALANMALAFQLHDNRNRERNLLLGALKRLIEQGDDHA